MQDYIRKQLLISLRVYLGNALVGCGIGWTAPIIPKLQDPQLTPLPEVISDVQAAWIGSTLYVGVVLGPFLGGYLSKLFGHKACLFLGGLITVAAYILLATATNLFVIFVGRILIGFSSAVIQLISLVYLGEISSTNIRGKILTGTGIFLTIGSLLVFSTSPFVSYAATSYILLGVACLFVAGLFFIPESPVYLVMKGKHEHALKSLKTLGRADDELILPEKLESPSDTSSWKDLFTDKTNRKALVITVTLTSLQQLSGVVVVSFFATTIFELAGSTIQPDIATIAIGVTQVLASCLAPVFVERSGRKVLLMISGGVCSFSLAVLGVYFYLDYAGHNVQIVGWLPLVSLIIFFMTYVIGLGVIPNTLLGELFHGSVRSTGSGLSLNIGWLFGFAVSSAFPYLMAAVGPHFTFWLFSLASAVACLFTLFFVPETKGKTFAEIQKMLS